MQPARGRGIRPAKSKRATVESVQNDVAAAIAEVRSVARSEGDSRRGQVADWLEGLFHDATDRTALHVAAATALGLYGGMGSFADVGTAASAHAVDGLAKALQRARTL
ncbi:hypothetical protein [Paeniglutamicibacter sp. Y32M11]|uniref:DUF6966 domain-containing protein n=1 Tax=Paeniglutamicibacter sp. Y32M11 TaxID=2853258 RepID=UPI001C527259|nr:hypothetical protein [Paeniglutamicibacter sp. Y32M11]QXQ09070.1 hypothetical protein KUF55_11150 [Paeniglutamicibacter sp. Y32M11]